MVSLCSVCEPLVGVKGACGCPSAIFCYSYACGDMHDDFTVNIMLITFAFGIDHTI